MPDTPTAAILNELLAATRNSPLAHLSDSAMFLSSADTEDVESVRAMMAEEARHAAALAELLLEMGESPRPAPPDAHAADLHYLEFHFLLPLMLHAKESLVAAYDSARARLSGSPRALQVVSRLETAQRRHLETLRKLAASSPAAV